MPSSPLFQAMPNFMIRHGDQPFKIRGVTAQDGEFCSFEARSDYRFRQPYGALNSAFCAATGISEPTYYAPTTFGPAGDAMTTALDHMYQAGVNLIRIAIEPALQFAASYIDPADGHVYGSDLERLDSLISEATDRGIVVLLTNGQPGTTRTQNITFLQFLADRYRFNPYVWLNPRNEIGCTPTPGGGIPATCNDPVAWQADQVAYVSCIRYTGFQNPIVLNPPGFGSRLDLAAPALTTNPTLANDWNLMVGVHLYSTAPSVTFAADLASITANWAGRLGQHCIFIEEMGVTNFGPADPLLNPGHAGLPQWTQMQAFATDALNWAALQPKLSGVVGTNWNWYIPGLGLMDSNAMHTHAGPWSTWGAIFRNGVLAR